MSENEFFHGYFKKSKRDLTPEDTDDFYDLEDKYGCHFVEVNGQLYEFWSSGLDVDAYGFSIVVPKSKHKQLMCYWYNGGAGLHEVVEGAIKKYLEGETE
ncbi:MAG: hypothetical protein Unbinned7865contig1001_43 [Prokaryotic dsDNA virus sp.]|nr:MAG: hypothetical protein Unbinned7865contig1001_43 [Prokaryotic dsDNA virus sp.]|tara:strand:+ start:9165 stop:9464 length:300 start_codon:yes stop_codon:yes gene_type:complete